MPLEFEWDFRKAKTNLRKHGVSLDEACTSLMMRGRRSF